MKKLLLLFILFVSGSIFSQVTISPTAFDVDESITITVDTNSSDTDCNGFNNPSKIYMHSGIGDDANPWNSTIGNWGEDDGVGLMTSNGDGTWSITLTPRTYYNLSDTQAENATKMGMVFRNENGSQEFKDNGCQDFIFNVGTFQLILTSPSNSISSIKSGESLTIQATTTLTSDFELKANDILISSSTNSDNFSFVHSNITENTNYILTATNNGETKTRMFQVIISKEEPVPAGMLDGINLNPNDPTQATLVLFAPGKEVVHLLGDFNNWQVNNNYILKKDSPNDRFWIELTGLTPQTNHMYQYLVDGTIKIADPYSTTILDEYNDQYINSTTYPDLPSYPTGLTNHAVTLLRTGAPEYNWTSTNYIKPDQDNLVIYELLLRDFDELHNFDAVKSRLDYLQDLGVNAIELMPVSEFDGNESWGYNPSFHMALDKYYGSPTSFKQFIDECHNRGIAIILDVVYNHATGQNPFYRLWNTDNGGYGGQASNDSPFFNPVATHTYSVFNDFNHSTAATRDYVKRTAQYWIDEYKIDGFRWDLTKGFTQNCTDSNESCTGSYQQDRVDVLKLYADNQWEIDPNFYIIFEHLGTNSEETQWADYGIMLWGNSNSQYNQNTMGYATDSNISNVSYKSRNWDTPKLVGYMESHDEERLMYKNLEFGNSNADYNVKDINTALSRQELAGMLFFSIPGPKMVWQFGELGYEYSINYCENGTNNSECRTGKKPIKWEYNDNPNRKQVYNTWSTLIAFKTKHPEVFNTDDFTIYESGLVKTISLSHSSMDVVIIGNFDIVARDVNPNFTKTGNWYNYFNSEELNITDTEETITLKPGEYRMFSTVKLLDPRGGTAADDSDNDGVPDDVDNCPNSFPGAAVNDFGCEIFSLPSDNFSISISGETCPGQNDGTITINAKSLEEYEVTINNTDYPFESELIVGELPPDVYSFCITVKGTGYSQCYEVTIDPGASLLAKTTLKASKLQVSIKSGTAPFQVHVNGITTLETTNSEFELPVNNGDNVEITSKVACEGKLSKTINFEELISIYPNPSSDIFTISVPENLKEVQVKILTPAGSMVSNRTYPAVNGKIKISLENKASGLYIAQVHLEQPVVFKIIKK